MTKPRTDVAPLKKVIRSGREGNSTFDYLECGHRLVWLITPDGFGGTSPAKRRRCTACFMKAQKDTQEKRG